MVMVCFIYATYTTGNQAIGRKRNFLTVAGITKGALTVPEKQRIH